MGEGVWCFVFKTYVEIPLVLICKESARKVLCSSGIFKFNFIGLYYFDRSAGTHILAAILAALDILFFALY